MAFKTYLISVVGVLVIQWSCNPLIAAGSDGRTKVTPPTLVVQSGHNFAIQSIVFSPDGRWLASAGWDGNVKVWDAAAGLEVGTLTGHSGAVSAVAFSPDNRFLASANANHTVTVWNFDTGKQKVEMHGHTEVVDSVAFTSDGQWLISGSHLESQIRIWSVPSGTESHSLKGRSFVVSPDATLLAVESAEGLIEVYEVGTWRTIAHLMTKGRPASFSPNGHELAIAETDSVHVWSIQNAVEIAKIGRFDPDPNQSTLAVAFDESWQFMASGGTDNAVTLWDVKNNRQLWRNEGFNGPVAGVPVHVVSSLSFHPKQKLLVSGNWDNTVAYLDLVTGRTVRLIKHHTERLGHVVVSPDGHWLAYPGENDQATLWDLASDTGSRKINASGRLLAFSPDSRQLAVAGLEDTVVVKDVLSQRETTRFSGYGALTSLAFSPDGAFLITATSDRHIHVWDTRSGMESWHLRFPANQQTLELGLHLEVLGFSDHGNTLVVFDQLNAAVTFWSLTQSQNLTLPFSGLDSVGQALLSVDGRWLAVGEVDPKSQVIRLYDLLTKKVRNIAGQRALSFSHDGRRLAVTTSQTSLLIVDTLAGTTQNRIGGLNDYTSAALTPTGSFLFVGTPEGTVLLYHSQTTRKEATLSSEWSGAGWVVVAPNGLFDGSSSGMQDLLAWKFGSGMADAGPIEMFLNEFYHPRLLSDVLAGKKARAPTRFELLDRRQPSLRLELLDPIPIQEKRDSEPVLVRIQARESPADQQHRRGSGVRDVRLFRNGSLVRLWRGNLPLNDRGEVVLEARIYIAPGSNVLSCYAFNSDNIKSADTSTTVEGPAYKSPRGTAYVIAVGISRYSNHEYDLRYARDDAELLATELARAQQRTGLFADVKIIKLLDQDATRSNIQHTLNDLGEGRTRATPNDTVFLYFAGHGLATLSRYYLVPHDLNYSGHREMLSAADLKRVRAHSISDIELQRSLEKIDAGRIVLIIDACNSGQALKSPDIRLGPINTASFAQLAYEKGMYVLAASQSYQAAVESSRFGHGLLTYALIHDGLQNGSADFAPRDGVIGIQEWLNYAVMRVPELDLTSAAHLRDLFHPMPRRPGSDHLRTDGGVQQPSAFYRRETLNIDFIIAKLTEPSKKTPATSIRTSPTVVDVVSAGSGAATAQTHTRKESDSAQAVLAQVDSTYEHLASYQLDVRSTTKFMRNGSAMSNMLPNMEGVTMIASSPPSKSRFETRGAGGKGVIQVTDGLSTVQYDENSNSYQQRALIPLGLPGSNLASADPDGVVAVSGQTWAVSSFGKVKNPRILREESLQAENRAIPCYVIEAETDVAKGMAAGGLAPKATYWIDKVRHLILRFEQKSVMTVNGDTYETDQLLDFTYTSVNEPLPDALFKFTPPKGATVRRELELPAYSSPIGSVAPQFALQLPDKSVVESAKLKGKVVILAFWTTWCTPCWAQLETLERIHKEFAGKDLVIFGINEEAEGLAGQFLGHHSLTLLSLSDPTASLRTAYSVSGVPSTVVIDKNGRTSGRHLGLLGAEDMRKLLETLGIK